MASSLPFAAWASPLKPRTSHFALTISSRSISSLRHLRLIPRCLSFEDPSPHSEGEIGCSGGDLREGMVGLGLKPLRRRPIWRRILFASKKTRSIILLNVLTVIYASDIPVLKEVEALTEPAFFNMVRFVVSAIPFLPFVVDAFGDRRVRTAGLELGLWVSLGYLAQALGLLSSDAGRASFITAFTVIVVPLIDGMFGASIPMLTWFGAIVSLVGIGMLECGGSPPCNLFHHLKFYYTIFHALPSISVQAVIILLVNLLLARPLIHSLKKVGDVLNILSAVFFGIHMLRTEQISRNTKKEKFLALLSFEVLVVAFSSVLWFMFKDGYSDVQNFSFESCTLPMLWDMARSFPWVPALYTGVFSTALCLWAEMLAMGDVSATETAVIYGLEPVWGAAFAWLLLGERWDTAAWIGAALVLCGSLTVQLFGSAPEKSKKVECCSSNTSETSQKQDYLSFSAIPVDSRKNIGSQLKRQDKTL